MFNFTGGFYSTSANSDAGFRSRDISGRPRYIHPPATRRRPCASRGLGCFSANLSKVGSRPANHRRFDLDLNVGATPETPPSQNSPTRDSPSPTLQEATSSPSAPGSVLAPVLEDPGNIGVHGIRSQKRKAPETALESAVAFRLIKIAEDVESPEENTLLESLRQEAEVSPPISRIPGRTGLWQDTRRAESSMLERLPLLPSFTRMILNIYAAFAGIGEKIFRFLNPQYYHVAEVRSFLNGDFVSNKRRRLGPVEDRDDIQWIDHDQLSNLIHHFTIFGDTMTAVWEGIQSHPHRQQMNDILTPLEPVLADSPDDLALLDNSDSEHDLCQLFFLQFRAGFAFLSSVYEIGLVIRTRNRFKSVPSTLELSFSAEQMFTAGRIRNLLSAPAFIRICKDILKLTESRNAETRPGKHIALYDYFIDGIVLDLEAIARKLPPPSFVQNQGYRDRLRAIFPTPKRIERAPLLTPLPPGRFPDDIAQNEVNQDESTSSAQTLQSSHHTAVVPVGLGISQTQTAPQIPFYDQFEARRAIKERYITSFEPKQPLHRHEIATIKSILKKRKFLDRPGLKRPGTPHRPKFVRFTETTLSPVPRGHSGTGIPKLWKRPRPVLQELVRTNDNPRRDSGMVRPQVPPPPHPDDVEKPRFRRVYNLPLNQRPNPDARIREILEIPSLNTLEISDDTKAGIEHQKEEERKRAAEAARRAAEEKRRIAEEEARKEREERLARSGGLREPKFPFVPSLPPHWHSRASNTLNAPDAAVLATTGEGVQLKRHDFLKVVKPTEWLNDEIVNGSLNWLDQAINSEAGITDVKKQTRKCLSMSSFFFKRLQDQGVKNTQRTLRRFGVDKKNFFDVDTILLPICERAHWTLMVIRPSKKTVAHMDSLNPRGSGAYVKLTIAWLQDFLEEKFQIQEWSITRYDAPMQTNGHDCGVYTITNGMCLALGLSPIDSYSSTEMPLQRLRIASMLLNGGFKKDFDLRIY